MLEHWYELHPPGINATQVLEHHLRNRQKVLSEHSSQHVAEEESEADSTLSHNLQEQLRTAKYFLDYDSNKRSQELSPETKKHLFRWVTALPSKQIDIVNRRKRVDAQLIKLHQMQFKRKKEYIQGKKLGFSKSKTLTEY